VSFDGGVARLTYLGHDLARLRLFAVTCRSRMGTDIFDLGRGDVRLLVEFDGSR
jgi:hypothetical protein